MIGNYRASPVICQNKNNHVYEQLGFIDLNFWRESKSPSIYYRNITNAWRSIYRILIDHFQLSEIVESLNNYQDQ
ncbi:hypothetical protein G9C98_001936 [Cotesia typhae]|uniref:Uncharacterized protein n=1 Tax=Cotesia typhae TaxID=2053667 RepID=A0A8J5QTV7_9HYME|nr:hypothetical protein G9C98_001936 [Cotesia typhae]